jgi:hypothetical protein
MSYQKLGTVSEGAFTFIAQPLVVICCDGDGFKDCRNCELKA